MKKVIFVFMTGLLFLSCFSCNINNEADEDIQKEFPWLSKLNKTSREELQKDIFWLKELIEKAETDETGNYIGCIWLEQYKGKYFYVTNMMLGSGGVLYWVFDSQGRHLSHKGVENCTACEFVKNEHFYAEDGELPPLQELKKNILVYSPSFLSGNCN